MDLTDFLLARISEDRKAALVGLGHGEPSGGTYGAWGHERVLAECDAKRQVVEEALTTRATANDPGSTLGDKFIAEFAQGILSLLALPYADHPDYSADWRL